MTGLRLVRSKWLLNRGWRPDGRTVLEEVAELGFTHDGRLARVVLTNGEVVHPDKFLDGLTLKHVVEGEP